MRGLVVGAKATAILAGLVSSEFGAADTGGAVVKVRPQSTIVTSWEGWGTSLCWWANVFGDRHNVADALFTLNSSIFLDAGGPEVPGLGLNVVRYNIGGSENGDIATDEKPTPMNRSINMPAFKAIEAYWQDGESFDPESPSWNWTADAKQREALLLAKERGADLFEAFANSPPWWMTENHATAGGIDRPSDNLKSSSIPQFAWYLAVVVSEASRRWGVNFQYIEPFNEPISEWWVFPDTQEGCHFSIDSQKDVIRYLRQYLDQLKLEDVGITVSDENSPTLAYKTLVRLSTSGDVLDAIAKVNTHGYQGLQPYRGPYRRPLQALASSHGKSLWDSEYGESDGSGLNMAQSIALDINEMRASAFVYWQALDGGGWGLLQAAVPAGSVIGPNTKFFVLAQFSRHIRPRMRIIATNDPRNTVVAFDAVRAVLVIVAINAERSSRQVSFDLRDFSAVGRFATSWVTETSGKGRLYQLSEKVVVEETMLRATLLPESVHTFEIRATSL